MRLMIHQMVCEKLTDHTFRKLLSWADAKPMEYYWKCKVCGYTFWNYGDKPKDKITISRRLKRYKKEETK